MSDPVSQYERELLQVSVARLQARAMAFVIGLVSGTGLFLATLWLVIRGGENTGEHLGLLVSYFPGYEVSAWGSVIGFVYASLVGGIVGWVTATIYNRVARRRSRT